MKIRTIALTAILLISALGLSACGGDGHDGNTMFPEFVLSAPDSVQEAYQFAVDHPGDLAHQPCYCGCGPMGHDSNLACFISDVGPDGTITFDSHATGCGICVDIAQDTMRMTADGKSPLEIREFIDARYGPFGPPTPTPMPTG